MLKESCIYVACCTYPIARGLVRRGQHGIAGKWILSESFSSHLVLPSEMHNYYTGVYE
jgi:hypothetical protein